MLADIISRFMVGHIIMHSEILSLPPKDGFAIYGFFAEHQAWRKRPFTSLWVN